ncbi:hypothetical protein F5884DRAFT_785662 [Xylogone sp. PMI_703]|nr:hypothetical protein F5884DRAFT_785662 [Xylogone sp. PMI_703]
MAGYTAPAISYPHAPYPPAQIPVSGVQQVASSDPHQQHQPAPAYQYEPPPPPPQLQQQQQQAIPTAYNGTGQTSPNSHAQGAQGEGQKGNRLRKACDSCSIRKVKCDESGPPCRACAVLDIPCTFDRPSRRRGPPNRHAEAIKKRRLEETSGDSFSSPTSPNNVAATLASFSSHQVLSAESICPFPILELLVDDFFTYIHPLVPFPHEPSFRAAFKHREDLNNPAFLALLASMVGILVASFPRKPRQHLKAQRRQDLFPNSMSLVERCHKVAVEARGPGYLDKELSVYDAATSYFLGLAGAYTFNWRACRLYFGETLSMLRILGVHKTKEPGFNPDVMQVALGITGIGLEARPEQIDFIKQEIGRRIFWIMFVGIRSMQQLGASFGELIIPPPTPNEPYPPLPLEVDDEYIYVDHVDPQPPGLISKLTGYNLGIQIYMTCTPLATMELAYGIDEVFDWNRQMRVLGDCLRAVQRTLDAIPEELMLQPGSQPGEFAQTSDRARIYPEFSAGDDKKWIPNTMESRLKIQYEIQKANIYASQLGTRSYIVEKYWNFLEVRKRDEMNGGRIGGSNGQVTSPGLMSSSLDDLASRSASDNYEAIETMITNERENIVKDLLAVLGSISQVNMEPNGASFINKIRQIASTLIDTPQNRKGPLAMKADEYLGRFLEVLMRLERVTPMGRKTSTAGSTAEGTNLASNTNNANANTFVTDAKFLFHEGDPDEVDEEELNSWADLREQQNRFAQMGGFLADI